MRFRHVALVAPMAIYAAAPVEAGLFGLPKFKVEQSDDRFSTDGLTTYSGMWNRISKKSIAGGVHIDDRGVFVEPVAIKRKADNGLVALSLFIHNEMTEDTTGVSGLLSLGRPTRITFLTGEGQPIALEISRGTRNWSDVTAYNSITNTASTSVSETGFAEVTPEQYQRIMNAPQLLAKVEGDKRSMTYEAKDISKSFQANLKAFWDGYVSGHPAGAS
jgi:hypothetical protein